MTRRPPRSTRCSPIRRFRSSGRSPLAAESSVTPGPGDGAHIALTRTLSIDPPSFLKALIGNQITIIESQVWGDAGGTATRQGTLVVEIKGQPGGVNGTVQLTELDGKTTADVIAEVKVKVPLIGGKVESYVAGMLDKLLTKDAELGKTWLAAR